LYYPDARRIPRALSWPESDGGDTKAEPWLMVTCPSPSLDLDSCDKAIEKAAHRDRLQRTARIEADADTPSRLIFGNNAVAAKSTSPGRADMIS
jgi:hypothetical protein